MILIVEVPFVDTVKNLKLTFHIFYNSVTSGQITSKIG